MRQPAPKIMPALIALALLLPSAAAAQGRYDHTLALMGGLGGSTENDPDTGLDNASFQGLYAMKIRLNTSFAVRAGQLELDSDDLGDLLDADLRYLTLSGQYAFPGDFYQSSLFLGVGAYDVDGDFLIDDETSWGLTAGVTGNFQLGERWTLVVELSGHYADLDAYQFFGMAHAGLAFHF